MLEINVKEMREKISSVLDQVEKGNDVVITRRGKKIARITGFKETGIPLKSLAEFRRTLSATGDPLSQAVIKNREEERF